MLQSTRYEFHINASPRGVSLLGNAVDELQFDWMLRQDDRMICTGVASTPAMAGKCIGTAIEAMCEDAKLMMQSHD
jgi:hypothetical protein